MLDVASVCIPCCMLLRVVESCCEKFESGQTFSPEQTNVALLANNYQHSSFINKDWFASSMFACSLIKKNKQQQQKKQLHDIVTVFQLAWQMWDTNINHKGLQDPICRNFCMVLSMFCRLVLANFFIFSARHQLDTWTLAPQKTRGMAWFCGCWEF